MSIHMEPNNSSVVFYTTLLETIYADITKCFCISDTESARDLEEIRTRVAKEGLSFLTKTLPSYGKHVDTCLSSGMKLQIPGLQKKPGTQIPKLFGCLLSNIFDDAGVERPVVSAAALAAYRQLVYYVYKLKYEPTTPQIDKICKAFVQTDQGLGCNKPNNLDFVAERVLRTARVFITRVLGGLCHRDIIPRHGPGAVATGEKFPGKMNFSRLYSTLEAVYPFTEYFCLNINHVEEELHLLSGLETLEHGTAKVVLVPKDSRGPRLISCEPLEYQWIQQGLSRAIVARLESHRLTKGHVNFTCQEVNRDLAMRGSRGEPWVTLDMKDASDRVSLWLVKELFQGTALLEGLLASRTTHTRLPDNTVLQMNKFAPMGSALCFPVESLIFYALAVGALVVQKGYSWRKALSRVYVYGDDIIMRGEDYATACQLLPEYGLMFNSSKCCTAGFFRESCGCDAYRGVDVTPIKLRSVWTRRLTDPGTIASYVAYSNAFWKRGYYRTAEYLEKYVKAAFGRLPYIPHENVGYLGFLRSGVYDRRENQKLGFRFRFNRDLQRDEIFSPYIGSVIKSYRFSDRREMFRRLLSPNSHTEPGKYAVPHRSCLKRG